MLDGQAGLRSLEGGFELLLREDDGRVVEKEGLAVGDVVEKLVELVVVGEEVGLLDAVV
jgi:hypothetical protein